MKTLLFIPLALFISGIGNAQHSEEYIETRIDSAWQTLQIVQNHGRAEQISNELLQIAKNQEAYRAEVTAYQVLGEIMHHRHQTDSAIKFYKRALLLTTDEEDHREAAYILQSLGMNYDKMGRFNESLDYHNQSIERWIEIGDTSELIFALFKKGILLDDADRHSQSLETNFQALALAEATRDTMNMINAYTGIGIVHKKQENYSKARTFYEKAIHFSELTNAPYQKAMVQVNLALVYKSEGEFQKAYNIFEELEQQYEKDGIEHGLLPTTINKAICSNRLGFHKRALEEGNKGLLLSQKLNAKEAEADVANELGIAYLALGQLKEALHWSTHSTQSAAESLSIEKKKDAEKTLSDIHAAMGDHAAALNHFKLYTAYKDTMFEERKSDQILELQTKYEAAEKEQAIETLEASAALHRFQKNAFLWGLIGVILFSILILNREIKRRKKARRLFQAEQQLALVRQERLQDQLSFKNRELTAQALHIAQKQQMIQDLKMEILAVNDGSNGSSDTTGIVRKINFDTKLDDQWDQFMQSFTESNPGFLPVLIQQYPDLSKTDLRICALIKMNLNNKDIATVLNISDEGVKKARYRLRKKLKLDNPENLETVILKIA